MKLKDLKGNRYGKLLVDGRSENYISPSGQVKTQWSCTCDCGNKTVVIGQNLTRGTANSCGCLKYSVATDYTNTTVGKLQVISRAPSTVNKVGSNSYFSANWNCVCCCGKNIVVKATKLAAANEYTSCGCVVKPRRGTHGHTRNKKQSGTFQSWRSMLRRCLDDKCPAYKNYGGEGVLVCDRWNPVVGGSFENFLEDMGERPNGTSLNRVQGSRIYDKQNCEWASLSVQAFDQKTRCTNTSGRTGVSFNKLFDKWEAYIDQNYKRIRLGLFSEFEDACEAREVAELKYFGFMKNDR